MTLIYQPKTANIHLLAVTLTPGTSGADRSRFYKRMRQAMWRSQIFMTSSEGLCMNLGVFDADPKQERVAIMCWLTNQALVREIILDPPRTLKETLDDQFSIFTVLNAQFDFAMALAERKLLRGLLTGLIIQTVNGRRFAEGA